MTKPSPSTARDCGRSVERLIRHLVERIRPIEEPLQDRGRFVSHWPCSPLPRTTSGALLGLSEPGAVRKKTAPALSLGAVAVGERGRRQGGTLATGGTRPDCRVVLVQLTVKAS
jgi:hypothetical protein